MLKKKDIGTFEIITENDFIDYKAKYTYKEKFYKIFLYTYI